MTPIERAQAAFLAIWPDGETCGHARAREGFAALREVREGIDRMIQQITDQMNTIHDATIRTEKLAEKLASERDAATAQRDRLAFDLAAAKAYHVRLVELFRKYPAHLKCSGHGMADDVHTIPADEARRVLGILG